MKQSWSREEYAKYSSQRTLCRQNCWAFNHTKPNTQQSLKMQKQAIPNVETKYVMSPIMCDYGTNIVVGKNCLIENNVSFLDVAKIEIGENTMICTNAMISTVYHPIDPTERSKRGFYAMPIKIGRNVVIGANAVIVAGVVVGDNSVVLPGSVVTKDVLPNSCVGGVPAKQVKRRINMAKNKSEFEEKSWTQKEWKQFSNERTTCRSLCWQYNNINPADMDARNKMIKKIIPNMGTGNKINQPFMCDYGTNIRMGDDNFLNHNVSILDVDEFVMGNNCQIAPNVIFTPAYHPTEILPRSKRIQLGKKIEIGDNVWICANAVIIEGVKIGSNSVVAAGAVVTKDVPENVLVAGVPAKIKKRLK